MGAHVVGSNSKAIQYKTKGDVLDNAEIENVIRRLGQRWFLVRNVHATPNTALLQPRWALSFLRGPMTLGDIRRGLANGRK